jgi:NAD(P)-dependent dehydrogenase (short-subunit alcohol dehydrogenase family)
MKTILITGCSSGFGLETAEYFLDRDWKVVATMRTPREDVLPDSEHLRVLALDVTDPESIRRAVEAAGPIDALVNNAGLGAGSPFEAGLFNALYLILQRLSLFGNSWANSIGGGGCRIPARPDP